MAFRSYRFLLLFIFLSCSVWVNAKATKPEEPKAAEFSDPTDLKALKYRSIGPAWGGRVARAAGVSGDPNTYYFAGAASGVWKSTDAGYTWKSVFDDQPVSSMGSLAIAPSDPNVIYVGSGEANIRGNVAAGNGIYKSIDAGKTWKHVWVQEGQIGKMVVHPTNPDIAFAAVLGNAFGPNPERGVYRTTDGGKTWVQVLKKDADTGACDVALDPTNPNILFAGLWQTRRTPWSMTSGGPGSGLYMSRDGGEHWTQLTGKGLPEGVWGKIGVAVAPSDSRRVYALIEAKDGGLFRSDDGGESWSLATGSRQVRQRAWYYSTITVNPTNPNEVWCPQVPMLKSVDGGATFNIVKVPHGDNHDLWIDPKNPKRMIDSDDGGVNISVDGGESWVEPPLPISQFYHVSVDNNVPFSVAGAMQDIGAAQGPSRTASKGIRNSDWYGVGGGESGWVVSDTSDPNIVYAGSYGGYLTRFDRKTGQERVIGIYPEDSTGHGAVDLKYRFQWTAPTATSPHNPRVLYHASNVLFRTEDAGQTWTAISPDLTRNDKTKQQWSGGPITGDNTGVEVYDTIFVVAESPVQKDLIWVGTDDGLVQVTQDGGKTWSNVTSSMTGLPEWGTISMIEPSRYDAATAYVTADAHRLDNTKPYLFKTTDFGKSWTRLDSKLPQDIYLHSIREDSKDKNMLYLATERGVAFSQDGGKSWQSLKLNLPTVAVHDLQVKDNSLVVGTMGRSIWIFDHLNVLREFSPQSISGKSIRLFSASDAMRWYIYPTWPADTWNGENPADLAVFYYWLKETPKSDITIDILDSQGKVINTLSSKPKDPIGSGDDPKSEEEALKKAALPKDPGVQMATWDLHYAGADMIKNAKVDGDPSAGPVAPPGTYTVRLTVDGQSETTQLTVLADPRIHMSADDYAGMTSFGLTVRDEVSRLTHMVNQIQSIRRQINSRNELLAKNEKAAQLIKDSTTLVVKLDALEAKLHNPKAEVNYDILATGAMLYSRMGNLYSMVVDGDGLPNQGMRETFAAQKQELDEFDAQLKQTISADLTALNSQASNLGFPVILP